MSVQPKNIVIFWVKLFRRTMVFGGTSESQKVYCAETGFNRFLVVVNEGMLFLTYLRPIPNIILKCGPK